MPKKLKAKHHGIQSLERTIRWTERGTTIVDTAVLHTWADKQEKENSGEKQGLKHFSHCPIIMLNYKRAKGQTKNSMQEQEKHLCIFFSLLYISMLSL